MKNYVLKLFVVLVVSNFFMACEESESSTTSDLYDFVGSWQHDDAVHEIKADGTIITDWYYRNEITETAKGVCTYNKNQQVFIISYDGNDGYNGATYMFYVYSIMVDRIIMYSMDDPEYSETFSGKTTMYRK